MKAIGKYFLPRLMLFVMLTQTFAAVDKIVKCDLWKLLKGTQGYVTDLHAVKGDSCL